ncbi:hypothetical protein ACFQ7J_21735 [Streptomyces sp. NPDC056501]|uniref:hypothetical protein n=1 Tax=Streptomyces sp. NPDC056501 TaxID=3345841 RepID=UPI003682904F
MHLQVDVARTAQITRHAQREHISTHIVAEATADDEIRRLVERFLQIGQLSVGDGGTVRRATPRPTGATRTPCRCAAGRPPWRRRCRARGRLDLTTRHIIGYAGPVTS